MKHVGGLFLTDRMCHYCDDEHCVCACVWLYCFCVGFCCRIWGDYAVVLLMGQKKYPIQYDLKSLGLYILLAAVLYVIGEQVPISDLVLRLAFRTVLLLLFVAYIVKKDLPLSQLPVINRFIKKK